ncbi:glycosyltransferase family 2 protein [Nocardia tengchongensis]|uniref:glycosyltransferase family 2 protein n=1 Tax=Nocardia tengchongensis TaxID=2055889 RepID=UPI00361B18D5
MLISVITPSYRSRTDYLEAAYLSLLDQEMPAEWEWEWIVQGDGDAVPLPAAALTDPRVKLAVGPHGGPGVARNLALERSTGELIRNLDSDDVLTPNALADSIEVLTSHPKVGWTTCRALDLMPDGSLVGFDTDPREGLLPRGENATYWIMFGYRLNIHPTTICIRRDLLIALGGWMALPTAEDTGMLLAVSTVVDGWFISSVGLHYRKHPDQLTNSAQYAVDRSNRVELIRERILALRSLLQNPDLRLPTDAELSGPSFWAL